MARVIEEIPPTEKTFVVELTQAEVNFITSAATALGRQGYALAHLDSTSSGRVSLKDNFKTVAIDLSEALESKRDGNAF